jgi:hypothetical protein
VESIFLESSPVHITLENINLPSFQERYVCETVFAIDTVHLIMFPTSLVPGSGGEVHDTLTVTFLAFANVSMVL